MRPSLFGTIGGAAAVGIVVASIVLRSAGPADPAADVATQRESVTRFHDLVRAGRWDEVYRSTTEPPTSDPSAFVELMRARVRERGKVTSVRIVGMRLLRGRPTPLLEVRETLTLSKDGQTTEESTVSYFARRDDAWLFAFSSPDDRARDG